ncbi:MAG TPA: GntP family permease [Chitinophagaceae bacterium]|nr:GntP family permease [Chitinophagaceae bacterium]
MVTGAGLLLIIAAAIAFIVIASSKYKVHPFIVLLIATLFTGLAVRMPLNEIATTANDGFGNMMRHIGLVVILGTLIGTVLEKSGATLTIANAIIKLFGAGRPVAAITIIGAVIGIPIFCDSGFVILSSLTKPLAVKTKKSYAAITCGLASGLYITHTLLPPHPGSIAGAANLGLGQSLGTVILIGFIISIPVTFVAWWFSSRRATKVAYEMEEADVVSKNERQLPALYKSLLPVITPIILITVGSLTLMVAMPATLKNIIEFFGSPLLALSIGLALSLLLISKEQLKQFQQWMKEGVMHAGSILILVGAGGVFGAILKKTALANIVKNVAEQSEGSMLVFLVIAWLMGVLLKTAQGSTTSAIIIVTSIMAPLAASAGFDTSMELSLLLASIAGGTMVVSHANDAYFWVISQFSGLSMPQTYKTFSLATVFMGVSVLIMVLLLALVVI